MNAKTLVAVLLAAVAALGAGYFAGRQSAPTVQAEAAAPAMPKERRVLYYRNPMGLPDTSPVPKKDSMGMDYVPVYEGDEPDESEAPGTVKLSTGKIQKLGVRTAPVEHRVLQRTLRAVGTVTVDERGLYTVAPRFSGWIETLHVNTGGAPVKKGQALAEVYSPELVSAQREYLIAREGERGLAQGSAEARSGLGALAQSALARLRNWELSEDQIRRLADGGEPRRTITLTAPASGVVMQKPAVAGMRFMAGEPLYQIADLSRVWLIAEVFEQDLPAVKIGQTARLVLAAWPDETHAGKVSFIYPDINPQTRTARIRVELPNRQGRLKPAMYGTVELAAGERHETLAVPESAVIDSGTRQVALVELGEGRFEPRPVKTGVRADGWLEILQGLAEGEKVVVRANFLIDAESNLKAALGSLDSGGGPAPAADPHAGHQAPTAPDAHAGHGAPAPAPAAPAAANPHAGHQGH